VDEELAASRGVDVDRTRKLIFFAVSIGVGATVAMAGPIGFVGMICPHICRLLVGHNHRRLVPAAWLFGGTFLALCNTLAFRLIAPVGLPVGVVTALLGGPFFLWLLFGRKLP
jgi:iron complex transport system permease protein